MFTERNFKQSKETSNNEKETSNNKIIKRKLQTINKKIISERCTFDKLKYMDWTNFHSKFKIQISL